VDRLGAAPCGDGTAELRVWAPACERVSARAGRGVALERDGEYWVGGHVTLVADFGNRRVEFSR
jgi:hypothetical protein